MRVSCNPATVKHTVPPLEAIGLLERLTLLGSHVFWPLDRPLSRLPRSMAARLQGYRQITDAVLLAAAVQRQGQLATLDAGMAELATADERTYLHVIPV